jgi:hypothetical protein
MLLKIAALKEYQIATKVFGCPSAFDPSRNPSFECGRRVFAGNWANIMFPNTPPNRSSWSWPAPTHCSSTAGTPVTGAEEHVFPTEVPGV